MLHKHHRKRRSQGGDDSPANVINIPDVLHEWIHRNPEEAYELGLLVKSWQEPSEVEITIPEQFAGLMPVKEKVKREKKQGDERRKRRVVSLSAPKDEREDFWGLVEDEVIAFEEKRGWPSGEEGKPRPWAYAMLECLQYTNVHSDETDFGDTEV